MWLSFLHKALGIVIFDQDSDVLCCVECNFDAHESIRYIYMYVLT
jgi:hypothetical protein